jgi:hypothetical protein
MSILKNTDPEKLITIIKLLKQICEEEPKSEEYCIDIIRFKNLINKEKAQSYEIDYLKTYKADESTEAYKCFLGIDMFLEFINGVRNEFLLRNQVK